MKTDPNEPIYPEKDWANVPSFGLTKREYFAAMAMYGIASSGFLTSDSAAKASVQLADALINELNKEE